MKYKLESRLQGEISITSDMQMITIMAETAEELKDLLIKVKSKVKKLANSTLRKLRSWHLDPSCHGK